MPTMRSNPANSSRASIGAVRTIAVIQLFAVVYFVADIWTDIVEQTRSVADPEIIMDGVVAVALIAGLIVAARYARDMTAALRRRDQALAVARGALAEQLRLRFAEWGLTPGEAEIALFAIKGCNVAQIAGLRHSAAGTVRAQLSQIYAKAGVASQSMLVSSVIEDLLDVPTAG